MLAICTKTAGYGPKAMFFTKPTHKVYSVLGRLFLEQKQIVLKYVNQSQLRKLQRSWSQT